MLVRSRGAAAGSAPWVGGGIDDGGRLLLRADGELAISVTLIFFS